MGSNKAGVVIVAAGKSERMDGVDKLFAEIGGIPLIARVIDYFQQCDAIDEIVVVMGKDNLEKGQNLVDERNWAKVTHVCAGGARRQDSVNEGLKKITNCEWVVIHDGARPLIPENIIEKGLVEAKETGAAIAAVPVKDTIKSVVKMGFVEGTLNRDKLWAVQTPQVFKFDLISRAHREITEDVTDDAMMVEKLGNKVKVFMGSYQNIKITTPEDLALAEVLLRGE